VSTRFWQAVAALAWTGLLLVAALVLAVHSHGIHRVSLSPPREGPPFVPDAPAASPSLTTSEERPPVLPRSRLLFRSMTY
jgi:hypothetical protein